VECRRRIDYPAVVRVSLGQPSNALPATILDFEARLEQPGPFEHIRERLSLHGSARRIAFSRPCDGAI
jgi:hypothetical protein